MVNACTICRRFTPSTWCYGTHTPGTCDQVACLACGMVQCHGNGTGRGTCRHCLFGRLPGWSFSHVSATCAYKGCGKVAVYAYLPGAKKSACADCGAVVLKRRAAARANVGGAT